MIKLQNFSKDLIAADEGQLLLIEGQGYMLGWGPTLPDAAAGWAPGAVFFDTDAVGIRLFVNAGTAATSNFVAAGDMTAFGTLAGAAGKILVGDGNSFEEVALSGGATLAANGVLTLTNQLKTAIADPGATTKAIPVTSSGTCKLAIAATGEERTLDLPTFVGQQLVLVASTVATDATALVTVASAVNQTGNDVLTFNAAGQTCTLVGIQLGTTYRWSIQGNDGVTLSTAE